MYKTSTVYDGPFSIRSTVEDTNYGLVVGTVVVVESDDKGIFNQNDIQHLNSKG